jgi:hypothetical protein
LLIASNGAPEPTGDAIQYPALQYGPLTEKQPSAHSAFLSRRLSATSRSRPSSGNETE